MNQGRRQLIALVISVVCAASLPVRADEFPRPAELLPNIAFWTRVYGEWTSNQIALCDTEDLRMIYRVIDVPPDGVRRKGLSREKIIKDAKEEVKEVLRKLDLLQPQSEEEVEGLAREIFVSLKDIERDDKYRRIDLIRGQNGLKDRFELGYRLSGAHDKEIKARLKQGGMPPELIAIVFVESLFYQASRSHAGAAGLWQFMPGTAREYMRVNQLVDERYDPVIATEAAIQYLKRAKERLGEWPVAITSYNYGRAGVARAIEKAGSNNIVDILKRYEHPHFGFAARNYYAEFLAALDVYNRAAQIFPEVKPATHWAYDVIDLPNPVLAQDLVSSQVIEKDWLTRYNPALTSAARAGKEAMPAGFTLRIPEGEKEKFKKRFALLSEKQKNNASAQLRARHKANGKQRLFDIAKTYDIFHDQLAKRLGYAPHQKPKKGSVILVRSAESRFTELPPAIVRPGSQMDGSESEDDSVAALP